MKGILRWKISVLVLFGVLFLGIGLIRSPIIGEASSHRTTRKNTPAKKRSKRYLTCVGFEWDNRFLQVGKKEDLTKYVKGTKGLTKRNRAKLIRWKSFRPSVIKINRYGIAKPKKAGTCRIRCRIKTRKGWRTINRTILVFDGKKINFSLSLTLSDGNRYAPKIKNDYNSVFDTVSIRIRNKTKEPVSFSKELLVCSPECSYVAPDDRVGVDVKMHCNDSSLLTVAPGKTSTIVYRIEGALSHLKENQKNNNTYIICHFKNDGGKKDLRYEMPTGRLMITK